MLDIEVAAHNAWDTYYTELADRAIKPKGRGHTVHGCSYFKTFMAIATYCKREGYDVRDYVKTSLDLLVKDALYITPKDLTTGPAHQRYAKVFEQRGNKSDVQDAWDQQMQFVKQQQALHPAVYTDVYRVLVPSALSFDAWFRVMYPDEPDPRLIERYGRLAWNELQINPPLRAFLLTIRPVSVEALQAQFGYFSGLEVQP